MSIEYNRGWSPFLVNVPLAGFTEASGDVWSPDGQYAAVQTARDLYFLSLHGGAVKRLSDLNGDVSERPADAGSDRRARTRGVVWNQALATTITDGGDAPLDLDVRALFAQ